MTDSMWLGVLGLPALLLRDRAWRPLRERIFHPFFTTREGGSGVGLANARKVVASHGGQLDLTSPPEGGACFRVRLPAIVGGRA